MRKNLFFLVGLAFLILGLVLILRPKTNNAPSQQTNTSTLKPTNRSVREIRLIAKNWQFEPPEIKVKENERVRFLIKSIDVDHGFFLPAFGINQRLKPGQEVTVEFVADKKGEYQFFCNVYCGSGHSDMKGKLVVE